MYPRNRCAFVYSALSVNNIHKLKICLGGHDFRINGKSTNVEKQNRQVAALCIPECKVRKFLFTEIFPEFFGNEFIVEFLGFILLIKHHFQAVRHGIYPRTDFTEFIL